MTVQELIEMLKKFPSTSIVKIENNGIDAALMPTGMRSDKWDGCVYIYTEES
jgi:hypothetical protein